MVRWTTSCRNLYYFGVIFTIFFFFVLTINLYFVLLKEVFIYSNHYLIYPITTLQDDELYLSHPLYVNNPSRKLFKEISFYEDQYSELDETSYDFFYFMDLAVYEREPNSYILVESAPCFYEEEEIIYNKLDNLDHIPFDREEYRDLIYLFDDSVFTDYAEFLDNPSDAEDEDMYDDVQIARGYLIEVKFKYEDLSCLYKIETDLFDWDYSKNVFYLQDETPYFHEGELDFPQYYWVFNYNEKLPLTVDEFEQRKIFRFKSFYYWLYKKEKAIELEIENEPKGDDWERRPFSIFEWFFSKQRIERNFKFKYLVNLVSIRMKFSKEPDEDQIKKALEEEKIKYEEMKLKFHILYQEYPYPLSYSDDIDRSRSFPMEPQDVYFLDESTYNYKYFDSFDYDEDNREHMNLIISVDFGLERDLMEFWFDPTFLYNNCRELPTSKNEKDKFLKSFKTPSGYMFWLEKRGFDYGYDKHSM